MALSAAPTARFLERFAQPAQDPGHEREIILESGEQRRGATVFAPERWPRGRPAWILLHGVTVPGRHHDALRRMARSLAAAGHYVIAPEVPAWRALVVDPGQTEPAVRLALAAIADQTPADANRVGLMGFSVAGRWALTTAAEFPGRLRALAAMGGYWDIERTLRAMLIGEHDWQGEAYRYRPDPYGRWIMGANLLPHISGEEFGPSEERLRAADALRFLAETAGRNGAMAGDAVYDPLNRSLRSALPPTVHGAWDLIAPPSTRATGDEEAARELARRMAAAAVNSFPAIATSRGLAELRAPVVLLHGRHDRLIPFTETLRLAEQIPTAALRRVTITRLFGHTRSREAKMPRDPVSLARELTLFAATIANLLSALEK
jgi:pimeloyl-ACP methyl ester carboxylesterase